MSVLRGLVLAVTATMVCSASALAQSPPPESSNPLDGPYGKVVRYVPKPAGTKEETKLWFGPYVVPPGHDMNRVDLDLPLRDGFLISIEPGMKRVADLSEPSHQEAHIHHAHWFALEPGNKEDNYTGGNTEWIFGNGDEETKANFEERSAADPNGPNYGEYVGAAGPQVMIYMLHNKTNQPLNTWIVLDVTFIHGTKAELNKPGVKKPWHDVAGVLFGRTFDVPRKPSGDGIFSTTRDMQKPIIWTSSIEGTIIGTGSHVHPGGKEIITENLGPANNPCPDDHKGYGGTTLLDSHVLWRNAMFSEDYQTEVTNPAWRAPIHKGDRLRITGLYENKEHAWYTAMTHNGLYVDTTQAPKGRCKPYFVGGKEEAHWVTKRVKRRVSYRITRTGKLVRRTRWVKQRVKVGTDLIAGVPNRAWGHHADSFCGVDLGGQPCDRPVTPRATGPLTDQVTIADFQYVPGDMSLSGDPGNPPAVKHGTSLRFVNLDQSADIRHSVTTCTLPCNGTYVGNYPWANGVWDSGTLGYDAIDGGTPDPVSETPKDLPVGRYAYFCRIHPWMRGQFEVIP